jgi:alpha-ketoglutarate-dependent taurine dioxygenase
VANPARSLADEIARRVEADGFVHLQDLRCIGLRHFQEHKIAFRLRTNDLLVWDNWRMIHGRNAFQDRRHHLRRMLLAVRPGEDGHRS